MKRHRHQTGKRRRQKRDRRRTAPGDPRQHGGAKFRKRKKKACSSSRTRNESPPMSVFGLTHRGCAVENPMISGSPGLAPPAAVKVPRFSLFTSNCAGLDTTSFDFSL